MQEIKRLLFGIGTAGVAVVIASYCQLRLNGGSGTHLVIDPVREVLGHLMVDRAAGVLILQC